MCLRPNGTFWNEAVEPRIYPGDMNDFGVHVLITWPTGQSTEEMVCSFGFVYSGVQTICHFFSFFIHYGGPILWKCVAEAELTGYSNINGIER